MAYKFAEHKIDLTALLNKINTKVKSGRGCVDLFSSTIKTVEAIVEKYKTFNQNLGKVSKSLIPKHQNEFVRIHKEYYKLCFCLRNYISLVVSKTRELKRDLDDEEKGNSIFKTFNEIILSKELMLLSACCQQLAKDCNGLLESIKKHEKHYKNKNLFSTILGWALAGSGTIAFWAGIIVMTPLTGGTVALGAAIMGGGYLIQLSGIFVLVLTQEKMKNITSVIKQTKIIKSKSENIYTNLAQLSTYKNARVRKKYYYNDCNDIYKSCAKIMDLVIV